MCYVRRMQTDDALKEKLRSIGGGFGNQVTSVGKPSMISPMKKLAVSFEEFMKEETITIGNEKASVK